MNTVPGLEIVDLLDALSEPALLVAPQGFIEAANGAAAARAGRDLRGASLLDFAEERADALRSYLARCTGSRGRLLGAVDLPDRNALKRYRCYGSRLPAADRPLIFLRCIAQEDDRFSLLNRRIRELNDEIQSHRHTQAVLQEAVGERDLLVREIHHRVKNNIQVLQGILTVSAQETGHSAAKSALEDAARRLGAMASVQQALYSNDHPTAYPADAFLGALVPALRATWPKPIRIEHAADPIRLSTDVATPLALIINELVTNAVKYAIADRPDGHVHVSLRACDGSVHLSVRDNGPGFELHALKSRTSGLGLVRGLARQIGGSFDVERNGGALCTVRFAYTGDEGP